MRLSKTIRGLNRARRAATGSAPPTAPSPLSELTGLSRNPGNLRGLYYAPAGLKPGAALVVVLHGCTQNAAGYDHGSGWSRLAERQGFALLFPEQQRTNNPNLCFNWYAPEHMKRGQGEPASIAAMVATMQARHGIDPGRIFVTGLSAGGAMASVMLATYPDLFAGGAIIAGLPYGCANGVAEAFECMAGRAPSGGAELAARVRRASPHKGPWPRVSIWHGSADRIVTPANGEAILRQWTGVHGLGDRATRTERIEGYPRRTWAGPGGETLIEHYDITGMAHGTPLMPGAGEGQSGVAMAHMLDARISSTDRIAAFFGVAPASGKGAGLASTTAEAAPAPGRGSSQALPPKRARRIRPEPEPVEGVQKVIEDALRAAGLMK